MLSSVTPVISTSDLARTGQHNHMSVGILDPDSMRRNAVYSSVSGLRSATFLPQVVPLPWVGAPRLLRNQSLDVVLVAVDGATDAALRMIEILCDEGGLTAMAYSRVTDDDLLIRCMRAGVREFMSYPFGHGVIKEAFDRVLRHSKQPSQPSAVNGRSFVFVGAKGGAGVTTAASNFAISLVRESGKSTLLIDLDLPLGDAALSLGVANGFSTVDALREIDRLDPAFLKELTVQHSSGLSVLAGPGRSVHFAVEPETIDKLIATACQGFEHVVVDAGSRWELAETRLFQEASTIYLVTQVGVPELRNANRVLMADLLSHESKVEIVLNRYTASTFGIGDDAIQKALTRSPHWRIPNNYQAVRDMQISTVSLMAKESGIQSVIRQMARAASGIALDNGTKKKRFGLFSSNRDAAPKTRLLPQAGREKITGTRFATGGLIGVRRDWNTLRASKRHRRIWLKRSAYSESDHPPGTVHRSSRQSPLS